MSNQNEENTVPKSDDSIPSETEDSSLKDKGLEEIKKELQEAKAKAEENWNLFLRTRADMDNLRRRSQLDNENTRKFSNEKLLRELLAVLDSLEHGIQVAEKAGDSAYKEGMELTLKLFLDILEKFDVKRIDPKGEVFDPSRHEAIAALENPEVPPNTVITVAQAGFILNDRVLRPARVVVAKGT